MHIERGNPWLGTTAEPQADGPSRKNILCAAKPQPDAVTAAGVTAQTGRTSSALPNEPVLYHEL